MPNTYSFAGDSVAFLGLIGVVSTAVILITAFRKHFHSPLNR
jgi:hypothetical protein